jgi:hypothetical protein
VPPRVWQKVSVAISLAEVTERVGGKRSTGEPDEGSTELQSKKSIFRNGRSGIPFVASGALLTHEMLLNFVFR